MVLIQPINLLTWDERFKSFEGISPEMSGFNSTNQFEGKCSPEIWAVLNSTNQFEGECSPEMGGFIGDEDRE